MTTTLPYLDFNIVKPFIHIIDFTIQYDEIILNKTNDEIMNDLLMSLYHLSKPENYQIDEILLTKFILPWIYKMHEIYKSSNLNLIKNNLEFIAVLLSGEDQQVD